jgi:hypothetical protein
VAVVKEAVEHGGDGGVAVEGGRPEDLAGGQDDGVTLVAGADDLEEQVVSARDDWLEPISSRMSRAGLT